MIKFVSVPLKKSINKSYLKVKPFREDFENFKSQLAKLLSLINEKESEEHNKNFIRDFLKNTFYSQKEVNTKGKTDLAIHLDKTSSAKVGVIIEAKSPGNKPDMISSDNLNCKALHEVILYYLRERIDFKNDEIKHIIITNAYEWFLFKAEQFEKNIYKSSLKKEYDKWKAKQKVSPNNDFFYNLVKEFLNNENIELEGIQFNLKDYEKKITKEEKTLIPLFKIFSPPELLKEPFANDSNNLNKDFYLELMHIIGLEEHKEGSKKIIRRKDAKDRDNGSLLENTIRILKSEDSLSNLENPEHFGESENGKLFNLALELNITWMTAFFS
jgi:adenine-specific DNA-methyltransferase